MDVMDLRRRLMAKMAGGLQLPSNVEVKTFALDADVIGSSNVTIPNPFGRVDMRRIIAVNFSASPTNNTTVAFLVNPANGTTDSNTNRKIVSNNDWIVMTNYYAIVSMTNDSITLRNSGNYNFSAGTYYMFAW